MNIYLDIDGVLLKKDGTLASGFDEFLDFFVNNYDVYWLTTHCRAGERNAIEHIVSKNSISEKSLRNLGKIKNTNWRTLKTEAIDFSKDFVWLDSYVMESEKKTLEENNCTGSFIEIDLASDSDMLRAIIQSIKTQITMAKQQGWQ